jgi:hypothetical protein
MKPAPVLSALLQDLEKLAARPRAPKGDAAIVRLARAELRAARRVLRAAYLQADDHGIDRPCTCRVCSAVWVGLGALYRSSAPRARRRTA